MPTHLKVILIVGAAGLILTFAAFVFAIFYLKDNFGPEHAAAVAKSIVDLPDPLPDGWQYGVGMDMGYQRIFNVQYKHGDTHALVQFSVFHHSQTVHVSAKAIAERFQLPKMSGMEFVPESNGEETISGKKAYYVREHCSVLSHKSAMEVAFLDLPDGSVLQVQSSEYGRDSYDPGIVQPIIGAIKGFHSTGSGAKSEDQK
jgi:hypothetical protein